MEIPEVRYARSGDVSIAYQVFGEGDIDLVIAHGFFSHIEVDWEWPPFARFLKRLGSFARVILFDKRGTGLSDPMEGAPTLEERVDDIRAVMDAAGSDRAALFGYSEGGPMCAMFAASHPERVPALILYGTFARVARAPDYEIGLPQGLLDGFIDELREHWPVPPEAMVRMIFPGAEDDPGFIEWMSRRSRFGASPKMAVSVMRLNTQIDIRSILPEVRVPTLVLHREGDAFVLPAWGKYMAERIPDARYVELEGADHSPFRGDLDAIVDEVEEFLTGTRGVHEVDRALATGSGLGFTDRGEHDLKGGPGPWRLYAVEHA